MPVRIQPSRFDHGGVPTVRGLVPTTGQSFYRGAPVTVTSGEAVEHAGGATVTGLYGFAMQDVVSAVCDFGDEVQIAVANDATTFVGQMIASAAVVTDLSSILVGAQYGLLEASNVWYVDYDDTSTVVVEIVDVDDNRNLVFFKVLASAQGETV